MDEGPVDPARGIFDLSRIPNGKHLESGFLQFELDAEGEERHKWMGRDGKRKLLVFMNRGWMGVYNDAIALAGRIRTIHYGWQITGWFAATADYQFMLNPAYNPDYGPVSNFSARLHAEF